ncbi:hypothetical protein MPTK1_3g02800 [Marchantia polymorpha subsp. ruderalis]|uniref:Uncharacterized protein n=2 Tax=Marchantia polymorpha TaxID=3197 RepID=A0AAF6AWU2_MARPO|nr:hypothetical protein MARPO_0007s0268 [Marchantia polymorpha]BBN04226.1 hypothetical protein Mp_3g02800 [Marchantia polymorpha subsp. ruderalis]|eukprot:PTQ47912.1 hypothetical protein MARPO_0007s0268 [Marchantia polymorpha]
MFLQQLGFSSLQLFSPIPKGKSSPQYDSSCSLYRSKFVGRNWFFRRCSEHMNEFLLQTYLRRQNNNGGHDDFSGGDRNRHESSRRAIRGCAKRPDSSSPGDKCPHPFLPGCRRYGAVFRAYRCRLLAHSRRRPPRQPELEVSRRAEPEEHDAGRRNISDTGLSEKSLL